MSHNYIRTSWANFPKVRVLYPLNTLKKASEELYFAAKGGDVIAALDLLYSYVLQEEEMRDIAQRLSGKEVILAPVLAEEHLGKNRIPAVFAELLSIYLLNNEICDDIVQTVKANHTNAGAYERIVRQPMFDGHVEAGRNYVILDDTVSMGGTLAALKGYIESKGGIVILAITLTGYGVPEMDIAPNEKMLKSVLTKHPDLPEWWKNEFGFPVEYLTQGELGHLRTPSSLDEIRSRLIEAGFQSSYAAGKRTD